jgi:hypothetical protein
MFRRDFLAQLTAMFAPVLGSISSLTAGANVPDTDLLSALNKCIEMHEKEIDHRTRVSGSKTERGLMAEFFDAAISQSPTAKELGGQFADAIMEGARIKASYFEAIISLKRCWDNTTLPGRKLFLDNLPDKSIPYMESYTPRYLNQPADQVATTLNNKVEEYTQGCTETLRRAGLAPKIIKNYPEHHLVSPWERIAEDSPQRWAEMRRHDREHNGLYF